MGRVGEGCQTAAFYLCGGGRYIFSLRWMRAGEEGEGGGKSDDDQQENRDRLFCFHWHRFVCVFRRATGANKKSAPPAHTCSGDCHAPRANTRLEGAPRWARPSQNCLHVSNVAVSEQSIPAKTLNYVVRLSMLSIEIPFLGRRVLHATRKTFYDFSDGNTIPFFAQVRNATLCGGRSADDAPELP